MKDFLYYTLIVLVISLIIMQPECLKEFSISPLGKLIFLLLIVSFAVGYKELSFLILVLYVSLNINNYRGFVEGMSNNDFRKENCKNGQLKQGTDESNIKYKNKKCNPCDPKCKFTMTTSNEQLKQRETVTPKDSKDSFIIKEALKDTGHVEPFSNVIENMSTLDEH